MPPAPAMRGEPLHAARESGHSAAMDTARGTGIGLGSAARAGAGAAARMVRRIWQRRHLAAAGLGLVVLGATVTAVSQAYSRDTMRSMAAQRGPGAVGLALEMDQLIDQLATADETRRFERANAFYNQRIPYLDDMTNWGVVDYWASPLETFSKGRGDCEDYAIAKYFTLLAAGMPASKLRMVYVKAEMPAGGGRPAESIGHMVLAYYPEPEAEPLVLDNLIDEVLPASKRPDLKPIYSFNTEGLWQGVGTQTMGDPMARISKWRDVMNRIKADGF